MRIYYDDNGRKVIPPAGATHYTKNIFGHIVWWRDSDKITFKWDNVGNCWVMPRKKQKELELVNLIRIERD